jgi:hypothetical protein
MSFKEMCAEKREEKDRIAVHGRVAYRWLEESLTEVQEMPDFYIRHGKECICILHDNTPVWDVKIETGHLRIGLHDWWTTTGVGTSYRVTIFQGRGGGEVTFNQTVKGEEGHAELREAVQFWIAQQIVDNDWDRKTYPQPRDWRTMR